MKISYNWLKQFIKIDWKSRNSGIIDRFSLEVEMVEKYQSVKGGLEGIVVVTFLAVCSILMRQTKNNYCRLSRSPCSDCLRRH